MSDIVPQPVEWLWQHRIPLGELTIVDGDPGVNKSTLTIDLAARVTTGRDMPDGTPGRAGGVLLLSAEDSVRKTLVTRLAAAGANMSRLWVATRPLTIPNDMDVIEDAASLIGAKLIVVDPLLVFLGRDANRDQSIRQGLAPLAQLAQKANAAILTVRHLNKSGTRSSLYRGSGSIGIMAAARSALLVGKCPQDPGRRVMCHTKSNLGPLAPSLLFEPVDSEGTVVLKWHGECAYTADDILKPPTGHGEKLGGATKFLAELLGTGLTPQKEVAARAAEARISFGTLERAKSALGVESDRQGFGRGSKVLWRLP
jgi:hypothetical protein